MTTVMKFDDDITDPDDEIIEMKEYDVDAIDKEIHSTLIRLLAGIAVSAVLAMIIGSLIVNDPAAWCLGIALGSGTAALMAAHMSHTLNVQMDYPEGSGRGYMIRNALMRFILMAVVLYIGLKVQWIHFIGVFAGIMTLKISALIQPLINKNLKKRG